MRQDTPSHERNEWNRSSTIDLAVERICTPVYQPRDKHWEITFAALGLARPIIENLWGVFYRINKSKSGNIIIFEFLNYFNLDRSLYVEKCFEYFDVTGGESLDFLEFVVSVWNMCTLKIDTLTNFTFDLYDLKKTGELSLPEIEHMVHELYGNNLSEASTGRSVLNDITNFAEVRGGVLTLMSFTIYAANHSLLLLPAFRIQRKIQSKVLGLQYWKDIEKKRPGEKRLKHQVVFDARKAHLLLRQYKEGGVDAMLRYCGDPEEALLELYHKKEEGEETGNPIKDSKIKRESFKSAVNTVKRMNSEQKAKLKSTVLKTSIRAENTVDATTSALLDAGIRSRRTLVRMSSSIMKSFNPVPTEAREHYTIAKEATRAPSRRNIAHEEKVRASAQRETGRNIAHEVKVRGNASDAPSSIRRHKERRRPKSAPAKSLTNNGRLNQRAKALDHRSSLYEYTQSRPRTPGTIVYPIHEKGESVEESL